MWKRKKLPFDVLFGIVDIYRNTDNSVKEISEMFGLKYKDIWIYMNQAVNEDILSKEQYIKEYNRKNSLARQGKKNPNYNGVLLTPKVKEKIGNAVSKLEIYEINMLALDYVHFNDPVKELTKDYALSDENKVTKYIAKAIRLNFISADQYIKAISRRRADAIRGDKNPRYNNGNGKNKKSLADKI